MTVIVPSFLTCWPCNVLFWDKRLPSLWDQLCLFRRVRQNQAYELWAFSPKKGQCGGPLEPQWRILPLLSPFIYNSVLIACGLVVLEEGHRETVIHAECRLFMWLLWGHAQKTFSLPVTLHLLASQGKIRWKMYYGLFLGLYEEGVDILQVFPRKELSQL